MIRANILIAVIACANAVQLKAETKTETETEFWSSSWWENDFKNFWEDDVGGLGEDVGDAFVVFGEGIADGVVDTGEAIGNAFSSFF